jgi:hypothetical protein
LNRNSFSILIFYLITSTTIGAFASVPKDILPLDTLRISNTTFEKYKTDYILKNRGVLILENCIFKSSELGSKNSDAILSTERVVSPIINYGKLFLSNCKFIGNYSWNTALLDGFQAQAASGAIANFGELNMSNVVFENNAYQKGYFTIIRDANIEQFSYIGNDTIYNEGDIVVQEVADTVRPNLHLEVALLENPVRDKADIIVGTNTSARIEIIISDAVSKVVFTTSNEKTSGTNTYSWNLRNAAGVKVSSGGYSLKVIASNNRDTVIKTLMVGVK